MEKKCFKNCWSWTAKNANIQICTINFTKNQPNFCVPTINLMERSQGVAGGHQGRVLVTNEGHTA